MTRILFGSMFVLVSLSSVVPLWGQFGTDPPFGEQKPTAPATASKPKAVDKKKAAAASKADAEAAKKTAAEAAAKAHELARMTKLKAMVFDRRRSTYMKVWSGVDKMEEAEKKRKADAKKKKEVKKTVVKPKKKLTKEEQKAAALIKKNVDDLKNLDKQIKQAQRNVTLGNWKQVKLFIHSLKKEEAKVAYGQLLASLQTPPPTPGTVSAGVAELSVIQVNDFMAVADMTPDEHDFDDLKKLSGLLTISLNAGHSIDDYMIRFNDISKQVFASYKIKDVKARPKFNLNRFQIAKILSFIRRGKLMKGFMMDLDRALKEKNRGELNHLSIYYHTLYRADRKTEDLEKSWKAIQGALAEGEIKYHIKKEAFKRAVTLSSLVKKEQSEAWLTECFVKRPELAKEILSNIGTAAASNLATKIHDSSARLQNLKLQDIAVKALLKTSPKRANQWQTTLQLLAENWLQEAKITKDYDYSTSSSPMLNRDVYGNYFYSPYQQFMVQQSRGNNNIRAIETPEMLKLLPSKEWMALVPESMRPELMSIIPKLYLKVNEEEKAFPYIEKLAKMKPKVAKNLVEEFLRVWTKNHSPNSSTQHTNPYMFSYGYNIRASGIPLTRSKQDRNLKELAKWVKRIQALPIEDVKEELIRSAFVSVHSAAEVYKIEDMERIFGNVDKLKPKTYASLVQSMRANLASVWRMPATQKKAKTNRKKLDIQLEVHRGYQVAQTILNKGMKKYPDDYSMRLAKACLDFDFNEYQKSLEDSTKYAGRKNGSLVDFQKAAELYIKKVGDLKKNKQTAEPFETWLYASLGAPDLGNLSALKSSDPKQFPLIKKALASMPKEISKHHQNMFANNLFTRLSSVSPAMKFRFLSAGFEIAGDNERAVEAKKVFDYYKDIVTEITLKTEIDGSDVVGTKEPFGVFVNIHHTKQIERESGGFARYLKNQTNSYYYSYNYGRPTANYRDKFEEAAKKTLEEHFEVLSVTFESEDVHSRATEKPGWRITPYAYLLLKPKGVEVDKLPALKLDLDFNDTSGYAVLPVSSSPIPLDASKEPTTASNMTSVKITETLDEREAESGKLKLEIKVAASGLVPDLKQLVDIKPQGFVVDSIEDEGVSVSHFDKESGKPAIVSDRTWMVNLKADPNLKARPTTFEFAKPVIEAKEIAYQRFVDADLVTVKSSISLEQKYGEPSRAWMYILIGLAALLIIGFFGYKAFSNQTTEVVATGYQVPADLTPFTVLGLLRSIHQNNGLSPSRKDELHDSIHLLEEHYFQQQRPEEPDLKEIAHHWVRQTS